MAFIKDWFAKIGIFGSGAVAGHFGGEYLISVIFKLVG